MTKLVIWLGARSRHNYIQRWLQTKLLPSSSYLVISCGTLPIWKMATWRNSRTSSMLIMLIIFLSRKSPKGSFSPPWKRPLATKYSTFSSRRHRGCSRLLASHTMVMVAGVPSSRGSEILHHPTYSKCTPILRWATKSKEWTEHYRWIIICCRNPCQIQISCLKIMTSFVKETKAFAGTHSLWWKTTCSTSPYTNLI